MDLLLTPRSGLEKKIAEIVVPSMEDLGFDLVRLRLMGGERKTLQIMAERPDGTMNVDDCAKVSRAISAILDVEDPISGEYSLEVSSPGIARPLVRRRDFERYKGHVAKIELIEMIEGRKRFRGIIDGLEGDHILIAAEDDVNEEGEEMVWGLPLDQIAEARLVMTDALLAEAAATESQNTE